MSVVEVQYPKEPDGFFFGGLEGIDRVILGEIHTAALFLQICA